MKEEKTIRTPKQKRSELTREKIISTALELFCEKGYNKTSTNEIAKCANISIGNLYFYYPNKEAIFLEILDRYNKSFLKLHETFFEKMKDSVVSLRDFLKNLIEVIIKKHEESKALNREIQIVSFSNPKVAEILKKQRENIGDAVRKYFQKYKGQIKVSDTETAATITYALINSIVDIIVFSDTKVDRESLINETLDAVEEYLLW